MNDNEAILEKVRELLDNTLKEFIEIKDTLIVLRSSENNIAESYTWLGADALDMIIKPLSLCMQKFKRLIRKPLNFMELKKYEKEIESIFETFDDGLRIFELYIIYAKSDLINMNFLNIKTVDCEVLETLKCNSRVAEKLWDRTYSLFRETTFKYSHLLPAELKVEAA
mgnify:CR=1 FL=1